MDCYETVATWKAAHSIFLIPVTLGMYLLDQFDPEIHRQVKPILMDMGYVLQVQNDFKDCFDNLSRNVQTGTDIEKGKHTWLIATAMEKAGKGKTDMLKVHCGKTDSNSVLIVNNLYEELKLPEIYETYEQKKLIGIRSEIERISEGNPNTGFFKFLHNIAIRQNWEEKQWWCA